MIINEETATLPAEQMAATLAHEIRNPLALIKANLQYVELCGTNSTNKKNFDVIYREIDRINDMLYLYMETAKHEKLNRTTFALAKILGELEQMFAPALSESGIRLQITIEDRNTVVDADYDKIKQVLINIIQNAKEAIEAAGKKNGLISVSAYEKDLYAVISVADNGAGLSAEDLKRTGTPFFTRKENGCGLGLSVSKEIMRLHKGLLDIKGEKGKGAEAIIYLPL